MNYNVDVFLGEINISEGVDILGKTNGLPSNSSVLISQNGSRIASYQKNILFPIGEYFPFASNIVSSGLKKYLPEKILQSQFYPGRSKQLIPYSLNNSSLPPNRKGYFMPLICFEVLFPNYIRSFFTEQLARPDFMVNISQDGWFRNSIAAFQHLELSKIRSVETRRALVRSTNSGISTIFGIDGRPLKPVSGPPLTKLFEENFQVFEVPINKEKSTFYILYGNFWLYILCFFFVIIIILKYSFTNNPSSVKMVKL